MSSENQPGSALTPLRFQTGNARLDAMGALLSSQNGQQPPSFNGFLPDHEAPRIVRTVQFAGVVTELSSDSIGDNSQDVLPSSAANGRRGEWAGAQLAMTSQRVGAAALVTR
ncbi:MAG: hypothetical protein ACI9EF_002793 [Pseudohongiellaceae bacterium]|jgi:hypothetical protein